MEKLLDIIAVRTRPYFQELAGPTEGLYALTPQWITSDRMASRVTFGQFAICCSVNSPIIARLCSASASQRGLWVAFVATNSSNQVLVCSSTDAQNWTGNTAISCDYCCRLAF